MEYQEMDGDKPVFRYKIFDRYWHSDSPTIKWCDDNLGEYGVRWKADRATRIYIKNREDYLQYILTMDREEYSIILDLWE